MLKLIYLILAKRVTEGESSKQTARAPLEGKRKLRRFQLRTLPGARRINPNAPWLEQARDIKR